MTTSNTEALPPLPTYIDYFGNEKPERRKRSREGEDERISQLFNGFDNVIENADDYTKGYVKAMRAMFAELMTDARAALAQRQQVPADDALDAALGAHRAAAVAAWEHSQGRGSREEREQRDAEAQEAERLLRAALTAAPSAQAEPINGEPQRAESESLGGPTARVESRACPVTPREEGCATPRAPHPTAQAEPQVPLSDGEIKMLMANVWRGDYDTLSDYGVAIVRAYEKARGIGKQEGTRA